MNSTQIKRSYLRRHGVSAHFGGTAHHLGTSDCPWVAKNLDRKRKKKRAMAKASRKANR